jgi:hypothetical protein
MFNIFKLCGSYNENTFAFSGILLGQKLENTISYSF